jgi:F0F1-type ATP synthase delta subunit
MEKNFSFLEERIFEKEDLISILKEISQLEQLVFKSQAPLSKKSEKTKERILHQFFLKLEERGEIGLDQKEQFDFLEELKKWLKELPILKLEIAFSPSKKLIERISQWLKKEVGKKVILDVYINPKIVGGAILEYGGKFANFSLAKEIEKIFSQKIYERL